MKKIISLIMVAVLLFSFAACKNDGEDDTKNPTQSTLPLDVEQLKHNWTSGILVFANEKQITLPCTVAQFVEASGLSIHSVDIYTQTLSPGTSESLYVADENSRIIITCKNPTTEDVKYSDATIYEYSFNNTNPGNMNIKFANTLTVGVGKANVVEALGEPEKISGNNTLYFYNGKNDKKQDVELRINFNSDDIVNSVAFQIED